MKYRLSVSAGVLLGLILSAPIALGGQSLVMQVVSSTESDERLEHVADRHGIGVDPDKLLAGGVLEADLGTGHALRLKTLEVESRSDGTYTWRGEVHSARGIESIATLTIHGQRIRGRIELDGQRYLLSTDSDGNTWLDRLDQTELPASHPEGGPPIPEEDEDDSYPPIAASHSAPVTSQAHTEDAAEDAEVDLLLFYSQASIDRYSDEQDLRLAIRNAVDAANTAFSNSEVPHRIRLIGIYRWDDFDEAETEGMNDGLGQFTDDPWVEAVADRHSADLSALIADYSDFCGLAWLLTQYRDSWDFNYSITAANQSCLGGQTLAHELGHNMGLRHDPDNAENPDNSIEDFAFGHFEEDDFQTIMAQNGSCESPTSALSTCRRIDNFSNPEVKDDASEMPTGESDRFNAKVLRLSMPHVSGWREPPSTLAEAMGDSAADYRTRGDSLWTVQDEVVFEGQPVAISGPVFGDEQSRLDLVHGNDEDFGVRFYARSFESGARGVLEMRTENGLRKVVDDLSTDWERFEVGIPASADEVRWVWRAEEGADAAEVGQVLVRMDSADLDMEVEEPSGESSDTSPGSGSSSDSSLGCTLSAAGARDPLFPLLVAVALVALMRQRQAHECAR